MAGIGVAVVAGASMGGLLAAAAVEPFCSRVLVLDRDSLPVGPVARRAVGQARHAHGLLATSVDVFDELLPGLSEDIVAHGGRREDLSADVAWVVGGYPLAVSPGFLHGLSVSRLLMEQRLRAWVSALPGVEVRQGVAVDGLEVEGGRVRRVRAGDRWVDADLVVDATGRGSRLPDWIAGAGYPRPPEERMRVDLYYVSRTYTREPDRIDNFLIAPTPAAPRAGALLWLEGNRWIASLAGYGTRPPLDEPAFRDFAATLPAPLIAENLAPRTAIEGPHVFHIPDNLWRRYDQLTTWPANLVPLGDSICVLNPVYGQGITLAALQARLLRALLSDTADDLAARYFPPCADTIGNAWSIVTTGDAALLSPATPTPEAQHQARFFQAASTDPALSRLFLEIINFKQPPTRLADPDVIHRLAS
ncbi:NAD(P)/FAD-dependent oxidoreductase [Actinokineospora sp. NPDC004072]